MVRTICLLRQQVCQSATNGAHSCTQISATLYGYCISDDVRAPRYLHSPLPPEVATYRVDMGEMKGNIASHPVHNIAELDAKVKETEANITQKSWLKKYKHMKYLELCRHRFSCCF
ncbi:hypothetical protein PHMEG_00030006 [Phytophthora megakarya]|uniref:Uncharacterized protein n=1 Tax=Phytophthora megakarya TaxID=4795 RepID=A0A225V1B3_9STRA|nr:hypothetical protein PHMEG_00030006 [Phytophthora megakarya]